MWKCVSVSLRLKAVTNIQKITKSMKMVSAAKYARAERELKPARTYGLGAKGDFLIHRKDATLLAVVTCYDIKMIK